MIDNLTFLREAWLWQLGIAALILWVIFLWKEWGQSVKRRFVLKAVIGLVAVCSLLLMALQPMTEQRISKGIGILLTGNYVSSALDSLQNQYPGIPVFKYEENRNLQPALDSIGSFFVLGEGLAEYDLWQFDDTAVDYLSGNIPMGITHIKYDRQYQVGDSLVVSGEYHQPPFGNRLILEDPAGNALDSIALIDGEVQRFKLRSPLTVAGNFVYTLVEKDSLQTIITTDPIPVTIAQQKSLDILMISSFPTFEKKYLKNFLAEKGHRLLVRSRLTKDRYKFEAFNREQGAIYKLSKENLANVDLLILDASSYRGLSGSSRSVIERAVREEGMGVFIQPDAQLFNATSRRLGFIFSRGRTESIRLEGWPQIPISIFPYAFAEAALQQPILESNNQTIAAYHLKGAGKIGTSLLQNTYQLILDGKSDVYGYLWSTLLGDIGKRTAVKTTWEVDKKIGRIDEPFMFNLRTSVLRPQITYNDTAKIAMRKAVDLEDYWEGVVYPDTEGWNHLSIGQDSTAIFNFFVADSSDYIAKRSFERAQVNERFFGKEVKEQAEATALVPINRLWLFLVFLLAICFLWAEPRFFKS